MVVDDDKVIKSRRVQEEGGGIATNPLIAGWIVLLLSCSSTAAFRTLPFVTLFRTAVERASCEVHKLLRTGGVPTPLTLLFWWSLAVSSVFGGRSAGT